MAYKNRVQEADYKREYYKKLLAKKKGELQVNNGNNLLGLIEIHSQAETARILKTTKQNIYQIERRALYKLRNALAPYYREIFGE